MTRWIRLACALACFCPAAMPQRTHLYWLGEAGGATAGGQTSFRAGLSGGAEIAIAKGFSAGPEIGFITPRTNFHDNVAGLASVNGFYHIRHGKPVLDPFVSSGWSVLFRNGSANFFNYGGGLNCWLTPSVALRAEFRDRIHGDGTNFHLWGFRLGVSFTRLSP
jgi:hypothetical protein